MIKSKFMEEKIKYDGSQLRSHWIYHHTGIIGDAIVAFTGPANVSLERMVDLVDVSEKRPIFSYDMLHFIAEFFHSDLDLTICYQRLLICTIKEVLEKLEVKSHIIRQGDDIFIYLDEDLKKLSISIATTSTVSTLIHTALNIISDDTPVPTIGLKDLKLDPNLVGEAILENFSQEVASMEFARCKVRAVR